MHLYRSERRVRFREVAVKVNLPQLQPKAAAPEAALAAAADLLDWWLASSPGSVDSLRARDVAAARAAWRALRERLGCPTPLPC